MMVAMNTMGYDAWAFGNHEFNFGLDTLKKLVSNIRKNVSRKYLQGK